MMSKKTRIAIAWQTSTALHESRNYVWAVQCLPGGPRITKLRLDSKLRKSSWKRKKLVHLFGIMIRIRIWGKSFSMKYWIDSYHWTIMKNMSNTTKCDASILLVKWSEESKNKWLSAWKSVKDIKSLIPCQESEEKKRIKRAIKIPRSASGANFTSPPARIWA